MEENIEEVSFIDIAIYKDGTSRIEIMDNGGLEEVIARAIIKDERMYGLMLEVFIKYQELTSGSGHTSINKIN